MLQSCNIQELETDHKSVVSKLERQCEKRLRAAEKTADKKLGESQNEVTELKRDLRLVCETLITKNHV